MNYFGIFGLTASFGIIFLLIALAILVFEVAMFISAVTNPTLDSTRKLLWALGMLLVHPFVAIAYYFTDYKKTK